MTEEMENKIRAFVSEWLDRESVEVYADYRDFEDPEEFAKGCTTLEQFEEKIVEAYRDAADDAISVAVADARAQFIKQEGISSLSQEESDLFSSLIWPEVCVEYPEAEWLRQRVRVDLVFKGSDSDPHELGYDRSAVVRLEKLCGTASPARSLDKAIAGKVDPDRAHANFLATLGKECREAIESSSATVLAAIATVSLKEYFLLLGSPKSTFVELTPQHIVGLYDPWAGGGSAMGVDLPKPIRVRGDNFQRVVLDAPRKKGAEWYSLDEVYGFSSRAFRDARVTN